MTEELPWEHQGAPVEPTPAPPDEADPARRIRTAVDGTLRLDPRQPRDGDAPEVARSGSERVAPEWSVPGWSPGEWSQTPREDAGGATSRRQLREMRGARVEVAPAPVAQPPLTQDPLTQDPLAQPPVARKPAHSGPARPASAVRPAPAVPVLPPVADPSRPAPRSADVSPPWPPSASGSGGPPPSAPPSFGGPPSGELEVYGLNRRDVQRGSARRDAALAEVGDGGSGRGDVLRAGVERWSRWAAGLGRPPRDPSGTRRYPGREGLFPPAVWLTAALGVAVVVGLVSGIVVTGGAADTTVPAAVNTTTVTVTNATTAPAVTTTTTRTRTKTLTVSPTPTDPGQGGDPGGQALAPGSSGGEVVVLQQELAQLGLFQGGPTGTYDQQTQGAVQNFQARAGITADPPGVAGPTTRAALNQATGR